MTCICWAIVSFPLKLGWSGKCLLVTSFSNTCGWPLFWTWAYVFYSDGMEGESLGTQRNDQETVYLCKNRHCNGFTLQFWFYENCQFELFQRTKGVLNAFSSLPVEASCHRSRGTGLGALNLLFGAVFHKTCLSAALHTCWERPLD